MEVFWFLHPDFVLNEADTHARLQEVESHLKASGCSVIRITPEAPPLRMGSVVHIFSAIDPETAYVLKLTGAKTLVTPALELAFKADFDAAHTQTGLKKTFRKMLRRVWQLRWQPIDQDFFWKSVDRYWVPDASWRDFLTQIGVSDQRIEMGAKGSPQAMATQWGLTYERLAR